MEKLTGKCREGFKAYHSNSKNQFKLNNIEFKDLPCIVQNALIIEFFDSVGFKIIIIPTMFVDDWGCDIFEWTECLLFGNGSRIEAQNKAIINANKIYNDTKETT